MASDLGLHCLSMTLNGFPSKSGLRPFRRFMVIPVDSTVREQNFGETFSDLATRHPLGTGR